MAGLKKLLTPQQVNESLTDNEHIYQYIVVENFRLPIYVRTNDDSDTISVKFFFKKEDLEKLGYDQLKQDIDIWSDAKDVGEAEFNHLQIIDELVNYDTMKWSEEQELPIDEIDYLIKYWNESTHRTEQKKLDL